MIKSILLKGFKSFLYRDLNLNKLTVLTGLNSSGKSSIIQALLMLEKAYKNENNVLLNGHGSANDLRNIYAKENTILSVELEDGKILSVEILSLDSASGYKIIEKADKLNFPEIWYISANRFGPRASIPIYNESDLLHKIGPNGENVLQCIKLFEYEPINEIVRHPNAEGAALLYNIRAWLNMISPNVKFAYDVNKQNDTSFSTFDEFRSTNVGFGLSYILPVITALLVATLFPNSIVIIENPEAHLHPRGQTEMSKLIALCAKSGTQVLIETHSDHIFNGIRIETKNSKDFAKYIQTHWFELDDKKLTIVASPSIDDFGRLNDWPEGFFDQFEINASELL